MAKVPIIKAKKLTKIYSSGKIEVTAVKENNQPDSAQMKRSRHSSFKSFWEGTGSSFQTCVRSLLLTSPFVSLYRRFPSLRRHSYLIASVVQKLG